MQEPGGDTPAGAAESISDTLIRRTVAPLLAAGALCVLVASIGLGRWLEYRVFDAAATRAGAVLTQLSHDPLARATDFGPDVHVGQVPDGQARAAEPDFDGRYYSRQLTRETADGGRQRFQARIDLAVPLREIQGLQLLVLAGGGLFVVCVSAFVWRRLSRELRTGLQAVERAIAGRDGAESGAGDAAWHGLAAAARQLRIALRESRAHDQDLRRDHQRSFELAPNLQLRCTADGVLIAANAAARRYFELDEGPLPPLAQLLPQLASLAEGTGLDTRAIRGVRCTPVRVHVLIVPDGTGDRWLLLDGDPHLQRTEEALRASEERYRRMFEHCNEGVWVLDSDLHTVNANAQTGVLLGLPPAALPGRAAAEFVSGDAAAFVAELQAILAGQHRPPREIGLRVADGATIRVRLTATALPGHERGALMLMLADNTALESATRALRESEQQLALVATHGRLTVWEYDCASGAVTFAPRRAGPLEGSAPAAVRGLDALLAHCHAEDGPPLRQALADHVAGRTPQFEAEFRLADARDGWRWLQVQGQAAARDEDGRARRVLGILREVSREREALAAVASARDDALRATRAKSLFLANLSHELRTPLNGVLGMLSLLERERLSEDQREFVDVAVKSGKALFELIDHVLDFSKIEAGALQLERAECDLRTLAEDVVDMLADNAHHRGLDIVLRWDRQLPRRIECDAARLRQVLVNLLGNAVKFTDRGHVTLSIASEPRSGGIRFEVSDTGIGIAPQQQQRIFEAFQQGDESTNRRYGGTGLGLSISRQLIELMHGELLLHSTPGAGSRFWFDLPLDVVPPAAGSATSDALAGHRLLLQERAAVVAEAAAELLRAHGAIVDCVADTRELRQALVTAQAAYSGVLLAVGGDLQGVAADIAALRAVPGCALLPVVGSFAFGRRIAAGELDALGLQGMLTRPLREAHVLRVLGEVFAPDQLEALAATLPRPRATAAEERRALAALQVLVVDDVVTNLKVAAGMLAKLGIRATLVESGRAALDAISDHEFQVVFMDCQMPGMDGFETTALIRARYQPGDGPRIIAMTANAAVTDRDRCLAHGMDDYLAKPVLLSDLERVLHHWARWPGRAQAAASRPIEVSPAAGLDRRKLEELVSLLGAEEFEGLCERFSRDGRVQLDVMTAALTHGDAYAARQAAHALKGAAANIGAVGLARLCQAAEQQSTVALQAALGALEEAFESCCDALAAQAAVAA